MLRHDPISMVILQNIHVVKMGKQKSQNTSKKHVHVHTYTPTYIYIHKYMYIFIIHMYDTQYNNTTVLL